MKLNNLLYFFIYIISNSYSSYSWILQVNYQTSNILLENLLQKYYININSQNNNKNIKNNYKVLYQHSDNFYKNLNNYAKIIDNKSSMVNYVCGISHNYNAYLFVCGYIYYEKDKYYYIILDILLLKSPIINRNSKSLIQTEINYKNSINLFWDLYLYILENNNIDYVDLSYYKKLISYKNSLNILDIFINESQTII